MTIIMTTKIEWRTLASEKKAKQLASIPKEWLNQLATNIPPPTELDVTSYPRACGLLDERELDITESDVTSLLPRVASGEWTALEVTIAFCKRAVIAQQLTNCLTEIFFERAFASASALDEYFKRTGKVVGALHGLPVSLKDQVRIKGLDSTIGYVSYINIPAERNAVLADILESQGAVLFVKTNVPQTLLWPETHNNIFGRTLNPNNRSLTSGGSSGGEGALVALKGSPLGVGSDLGGQVTTSILTLVYWVTDFIRSFRSIRIPSACCGTYGLRPSYGRVPYGGCANSLEGQDSILSVLGPLSNSIDGLKLFMKAVIDSKPWMQDPLAVRKRWNEEEYQLADHGGGQELCFAVLWDDGVTVPDPPILRGLEMTKKALLAAGHKVIDWTPLKHAEIYDCILAIGNAGAAEDCSVVVAVSGEPLIETMLPNALESETAFKPSSGTSVSAYQLWQVQKERRTLREEYLRHWQDTVAVTGTGRPVDAILCPIASSAAPPHGTTKNTNYTMIWNALDYAALAIPVSKVDQKLDVKRERKTFYNSTDQSQYEDYNPATFANAPIAIQVVGRTLEEEAVLGMSEIVDSALKTRRAKL
ncbi:hypothetical protein V5O48_001567 [Marasmius crinis-equi]|uniref:Amidase domain-containing protein n=1 Tax=Marasmius crinis-equi TaxID=585013 RepID=A0ABR3FY64_9AGAR